MPSDTSTAHWVNTCRHHGFRASPLPSPPPPTPTHIAHHKGPLTTANKHNPSPRTKACVLTRRRPLTSGSLSQPTARPSRLRAYAHAAARVSTRLTTTRPSVATPARQRSRISAPQSSVNLLARLPQHACPYGMELTGRGRHPHIRLCPTADPSSRGPANKQIGAPDGGRHVPIIRHPRTADLLRMFYTRR